MNTCRVDKLAWLGLALAASAYVLILVSYRYLYGLAEWPPVVYWFLTGAISVGVGVCLVAVGVGLFSLKTTDRQQKLRAWTALLVGMTVVIICGFHVYILWRWS